MEGCSKVGKYTETVFFMFPPLLCKLFCEQKKSLHKKMASFLPVLLRFSNPQEAEDCGEKIQRSLPGTCTTHSGIQFLPVTI